MSREERLKRYVSELRRKLSYAAVQDVYRRARERDRKAGRFPLYKLVRNLPSVSVRMDGTKNHKRPHVHISVGKQKHAASLAIDNGELLAGKLKPYELREVQTWISAHKRALLNLWSEMQAGRPVDELICELRAKENVPMYSPSMLQKYKTSLQKKKGEA
ncbi:DUF4160 domain-containing protein [Bradyrhizobium sp. McL0615]|uniref:DUF4160 domain-containing protein n=1 Tax=Bradyrhizobium sp. McL0615 TaxID=3415673 RepID=UPI003CF0785C